MRTIGTLLVSALALAPGAVEAQSADLTRTLQHARAELAGLSVPAAEAFVTGDREIAVGDTVNGTVAAIGTLRVGGTIVGDAFSYGGDIILLDGGHITGSAVAFEGSVANSAGRVDGDARSIRGADVVVPHAAAGRGTGEMVALTLGWSAVALIVGLGILVFGGRTLDAIGLAVQEHFGRSLVAGIAATLAFAPALAVVVLALVVTILGILLVPFAVVAYVLAITGLVALGFLAAVRVTGQALVRPRVELSERGAALQSFVVGIVFFFGLWLIAAMLTGAPAAASVARVIAFALTWAAATVGLGATILTRAGTRTVVSAQPASVATKPEPGAPKGEAPVILPQSEWQTPTPATGVVAARRPTTVKR